MIIDLLDKKVNTKGMLIGESWVDTPMQLPVFNPFSGNHVYSISCAEEEHVYKALESAEKGKIISKNLSPLDRSEIINKVVNLLKERKEEFTKVIVNEGVKTKREAGKEVDRCINTLTLCGEEAKRVIGETVPFAAFEGGSSKKGYYVYDPIGIITAITPFNDPLNLVAHKLGPAIAAGNAVILKPSDFTPISGIKLGELFLEAGLPYHILNIITGPIDNFGDILVTDSRIDMVSFTGGSKSGEVIAKAAGVKKIGMELGSSSPVIVMNDVDVEAVAKNCIGGMIWAAGQNCVGVKRMYVHDTIYDSFKEKIINLSKAVKLGNPEDDSTDMGPIINQEAISEIERSIENLVKGGYKVLCGGKRVGNGIEPTIIEGDFDNKLNGKEEIFGPVATISRVNSLEEGIIASNDSPYGLHAGIFTNNIEHAFKASNELQCGGVMINDSSDYRIDMMPFGGVKKSGIGREGVRSAIREMSSTKIICFNLK
ncbi:aldehyde dehydrogenase family protein [uncultured Tenacibaculum sp.]|uniref:aldehyde dehydrogenase family protein n=1 Tax=uncultured Tenacibaculum sp. TaxID=174713 RepID=UPI002635C486|nr:aldehyde dehydrogenase family protein [uncultured Tenacibaculum sp.]